jgi:shikimate dehydrogenase
VTLRFAVLGSPIAHSRSPLLHRTALAALGADAEYGSAEVRAGELEAFVDGLDADWRGLSLTMPLKEDALSLADEVDEVARLSGAVNTLLLTGTGSERRVAGFNTDVHGIVRALADGGVERIGSALILGGGATARSAAVAVAQLGAEHLDVVLRDPAKAESVEAVARGAGLTVSVHPLATAGDRIAPDLTISTLPGATGVEERLAEWAAPASGALLDVAYHPWPSPLATLWREHGSIAVSGLAMLVHQAVAQERIWWNGDPLAPLPGEADLTARMLAAVADA